MSETTVDNVTDSPVETEITENSNAVLAVAGGALVGVAATVAVRFVIRKIRARKEAIHVVADLEDETAAS